MQPILHSVHRITGDSTYAGQLALVTYIGKYGYTLTLLGTSKQLPCTTFSSYDSFIKSTQVEFLVNPHTSIPCQSVEEFKYCYPEYFI